MRPRGLAEAGTPRSGTAGIAMADRSTARDAPATGGLPAGGTAARNPPQRGSRA